MNAVATSIPWQPCQKAGWPAVQVKHMFETALGKMLQPQPGSDDDIEAPYIKSLHVQWRGVSFEDLPTMWASPKDIEQLALRVGDLMVCEGGEVGRGALILNDPPPLCIFQNALHRVRSRELNDVRYLNYCLKQASEAGWFDVLCNRATIAHFTVEKFRELRFHLPSSETQGLIVTYLDRETARIDGLVAEKERMLALLEEKRAALISRIVTRGLESHAPLKHSGQDWLGDIPAHWEVPRAKGLFREVDRRTETGEETLLSLRMGKGLVPHNEVSEKILEASDVTGFKKIEPGQMVINRMRAASGLIAVARETGLVSPDYAVFNVVDQELSIEYFLELFKTSLLQAVFRSSSKGLGTGEQGFLRLYTDAFLSLHFPYPPVDEQREIVKFIAQQRSEILQMESLLRRSIDLAKERRSALITAAVTGQISLVEMRV